METFVKIHIGVIGNVEENERLTWRTEKEHWRKIINDKANNKVEHGFEKSTFIVENERRPLHIKKRGKVRGWK